MKRKMANKHSNFTVSTFLPASSVKRRASLSRALRQSSVEWAKPAWFTRAKRRGERRVDYARKGWTFEKREETTAKMSGTYLGCTNENLTRPLPLPPVSRLFLLISKLLKRRAALHGSRALWEFTFSSEIKAREREREKVGGFCFWPLALVNHGVLEGSVIIPLSLASPPPLPPPVLTVHASWRNARYDITVVSTWSTLTAWLADHSIDVNARQTTLTCSSQLVISTTRHPRSTDRLDPIVSTPLHERLDTLSTEQRQSIQMREREREREKKKKIVRR